jgi:predicted transcriptional regulator of viral defense system
VGNIERAGHGLYRLATEPISEHDDLVRLTLWSRDRSDEPQAVVSHLTALVVHDLTDLLPRSIHLTVPPRFQKKVPRGCKLHREILASPDIEERDGFRVTTPFRTLLDAAHSPEVPQDELERAIRAALDRGLVRRGALIDAAQNGAGINRLRLGLEIASGDS